MPVARPRTRKCSRSKREAVEEEEKGRRPGRATASGAGAAQALRRTWVPMRSSCAASTLFSAARRSGAGRALRLELMDVDWTRGGDTAPLLRTAQSRLLPHCASVQLPSRRASPHHLAALRLASPLFSSRPHAARRRPTARRRPRIQTERQGRRQLGLSGQERAARAGLDDRRAALPQPPSSLPPLLPRPALHLILVGHARHALRSLRYSHRHEYRPSTARAGGRLSAVRLEAVRAQGLPGRTLAETR